MNDRRRELLSELSGNEPDSLPRRHLLKAAASLPILGAAASLVGCGEENHGHQATQLRELDDAQKMAGDPTGARPGILTEHEFKTLEQLCDWIIPEDGRSVGARQAGVPAFIDGWVGHMRRDLAPMRGGIRWLDNACRQTFGSDFMDCDPTEQQNMLDRIAWPGKSRPGDEPGEAFFNRLRDLTVGAFFSTEVGVRDLPYLGNRVLKEWRGCPDEVLAALGVQEV